VAAALALGSAPRRRHCRWRVRVDQHHLSRTNAAIDNSTIGSDAHKVGSVVLEANSTSAIQATVAGVALAVGIGDDGAGVGAAVGIAVARNYIGWDPEVTGVVADYDNITFDSNGQRSAQLVASLTPPMRRPARRARGCASPRAR